jgi:hypothetical protein
VKKFLVTMLTGAFLFASLAATIGCGEDTTKKDKDKDAKKDEKKDDKKP